MNNSLVFKGNEITPFDNGDGKIWFTAEILAGLLGYTDSNKILNLYNRHRDEFTENMTAIAKVRMNGINNSLRDISIRLFSPRGAHLIGIFSRTKVAKALRRWLLDLADKESKMPILIAGYTIQQIQNIVSQARKTSDEDSSDAGFRLRKRRDDLPMIQKAEKFVEGLGQIGFEPVGGGKEADYEK